MSVEKLTSAKYLYENTTVTPRRMLADPHRLLSTLPWCRRAIKDYLAVRFSHRRGVVTPTRQLDLGRRHSTHGFRGNPGWTSGMSGKSKTGIGFIRSGDS